MDLNISLSSVFAITAVLLVAGFVFFHWYHLFREKKVSKLKTQLQARTLALRPAPPPPEPQPIQDESVEAVRFIMLFTDMVKKLSAARSAEEVPSVLVRMIGNLIGAPSVAYFEYDDEQDLLRLKEGRGLAADLPGKLTFPLGQGKIGYAAQVGMVMDERDLAAETMTARQQITAVPTTGVPTAYCAPMVHRGELLGIITVAEPGYRSPHIKKLLSAVADLAAISLHNAQLMGRFAHRADTDGLTGLFTRRYFARRLAEEVIRCGNYGDPLSLVMLDVDNFKHYNDTNGHPAGDEVLRTVAEVLRRSFRRTDMVTRYGGEEFAVVMSGLKKEQAYLLAERLRTQIEETHFEFGARQPLGRVTVSAGVASFPQDGGTGDELIAAADQALYEAKRAGRNRVVQHEAAALAGREDVLELEQVGPSGRTAALEAFLAATPADGGEGAKSPPPPAAEGRVSPAAPPEAKR